MLLDLQKATIWKRISAFLFDMIMLSIIVVGLACAMSGGLGYDRQNDLLEERYHHYEQLYHTDFDMSESQLLALTPEGQQAFQDAYEALTNDETAMHAYSMMIHLGLVISSISTLLGFLILEFAVPLKFGNGQTLGKKIFGIGVMRTDGVKMNTMQLFVRTVLGKYTIETMVPLLIGTLIFFGSLGILGTLILAGLALTQIILLIATRTNSLLHDILAGTVAVDLASQMIFESEQALIDYKKQLHAEQAARQSY